MSEGKDIIRAEGDGNKQAESDASGLIGATNDGDVILSRWVEPYVRETMGEDSQQRSMSSRVQMIDCQDLLIF